MKQLVLPVEVAEYWLKYLHDCGRGHHPHADHGDFVEHDCVGSWGTAGHLLGGVGKVQGVRRGHTGHVLFATDYNALQTVCE